MSRVVQRFALAALTALACLSLFAETTKVWEQTDFGEFSKGKTDGVTIRSDGKLILAPKLSELYETSSSYIWALAADSRGNLFAGTGPEAKVFRITSGGDASVYFETEGVEIHALAVDSSDDLYAATSPESKVYKIDPDGNSSVFFEPDVDYVWDMAFDSKKNLFLATGDKGRIFRITPSGEGELFFETEETHIRSIVIDDEDNLVVGTDPSGLILRVSPAENGAPKSFVLYQVKKQEITDVIQARDGTIYAAAVGDRKATPPRSPRPTTRTRASTPQPQPQAPPSPVPGNPPAGGQQQTVTRAVRAPRAATAQLTGGSEVYRISPDGEPHMIWDHQADLAYALAFDPDGKVLIGTGNDGKLVRLESDTVSSLVLTTPSQQITALAAGPQGRVYMGTSNVGKIYQLGPGDESEGNFESEPFDAEIFTQWGRLEWQGETPGSSAIEVSLRTGNLDSPARNWSDWSRPVSTPGGARVASPASRFAQWRAVLDAGKGNQSPVLQAVRLYYLRKNVAPQITHIETTPANYTFVRKSVVAARTRNLPPLGAEGPERKPQPQPAARPSHTLTPQKGHIGIRWAAEDANEDELVFQLEIRGEEESQWKMLEEKVEADYLSWDSTSFPDGLYQVRITASDRPSNPESEAKSHSRVSAPFRIDNSAPRVSDLRAVVEDGRLQVQFVALDTTTKVQKAEYSLDGGDWKPVLPETRLFDSKELSFDFETDDIEPGEHTVAVRVYDAHDNLATGKVVVRQTPSSDGNGN